MDPSHEGDLVATAQLAHIDRARAQPLELLGGLDSAVGLEHYAHAYPPLAVTSRTRSRNRPAFFRPARRARSEMPALSARVTATPWRGTARTTLRPRAPP